MDSFSQLMEMQKELKLWETISSISLGSTKRYARES